MIFQITPSNQRLLFEARLQIDGPFKDLSGLSKEVGKYAERQDSVAYVFMIEDSPVGYVEVKLHEDQTPTNSPPLPILNYLGHIARIGTHQHHRKSGVGTRLLEAAEHWLMSANRPGMWLDYYSDNFPAAQLYAKFGFGQLAEFADHTEPTRKRRIASKIW